MGSHKLRTQERLVYTSDFKVRLCVAFSAQSWSFVVAGKDVESLDRFGTGLECPVYLYKVTLSYYHNDIVSSMFVKEVPD